jgi:hypothetical protein
MLVIAEKNRNRLSFAFFFRGIEFHEMCNQKCVDIVGYQPNASRHKANQVLFFNVIERKVITPF